MNLKNDWINMQIFYIKNALLININDLPITKIEEKNGLCFLYNNDDIVGVNIFNLPANFSFKPGLIYPTQELIDYIQKATKLTFVKEVNFVVGEVVSCEDIPESHLHKCVVNDGHTNYDIVCGASNVKAGIKIVMAKANTIMPNGKRLVPGKLMGYASNGMICSARELKIATSKEEHGVMILDNSYTTGEEFTKVYTNLK